MDQSPDNQILPSQDSALSPTASVSLDLIQAILSSDDPQHALELVREKYFPTAPPRSLWIENSGRLNSASENTGHQTILTSKNEILGTLYWDLSPTEMKAPHSEISQFFAKIAVLFAAPLERLQSEQKTKLMFQLLQNSQERLHLALSSQNIGVWDWHIQANKLIWDQTMFQLFGVDPQKATGTFDDFKSSVHPDDLEETQSVIEKSLQDGNRFHHQFRIIKQGQVFYVAAAGHLVRDHHDKPLRMTGLNWDITESVLAKKKLDIERAKSIAASKMATLGEMASGIAHEINNPLTIIKNRASLLKDKLNRDVTNSEPYEVELQKIELTVERISKIIRGLRQFSRNAESDPMISCDLNTIVDETLELCRERLKRHQIQLSLKGFHQIFHLKVRPTQISQVLLNLISNSFDAIHDQPGAWIELKASPLPEEILELSITDSGSGIPANVAEKIMNPFFTTKEIGQGTGLGLSISKGIIEDHSGKLFYDENSPNTRFVIHMPIDTSEAIVSSVIQTTHKNIQLSLSASDPQMKLGID